MNQKTNIGRKTQIKNVAQVLFSEKGYAASSMRDLAKKVGIEPASLYSHITSKESLLREICFGMANEFFKELEKTDRLKLSCAEKLKQYIMCHVNVIQRNDDASIVFLHEWRFLSEPNLGRFKKLRKQYQNKFEDVLEKGMKNGEFKNIDVKIILLTLFSALTRSFEYFQQASNYNAEYIGDQIFDLFFTGIQLQKNNK
jgi:TetR/AcrR family transcriptional regulator, cholesterol catabolism regulator